MKHDHSSGSHRDSHPSETHAGPDAGSHGEHHGRGHHHGRHHGHRGGGGRGGRMFDYGDLRLLLLAMLAEAPRHGYELIKSIEERLGGSYTPSPGVIYPTLSWLEDMGYASVEAEGGRKSYSVTSEGEAFLAANRAAADDLLARGGPGGERGRPPMPAPVLRAMENLKLAMRLRLKQGPLDDAAADQIAAALDAAAGAVERAR
ncbi:MULTISPECIES: PadR family transcriptional regulator [unclassified Aureimonas]|uniref:PadR family transcriptional regulator n=1 Tax=unclassified Aureimonas TaxID=2615206 RepID=UPI0006F55045|nr:MULTISPECIES: PadR family transcriptional regulator [unclassified Aureimonas]KQT60508.1 PadR family transcriptional regulator [Aureimonas sp. Leaf427]KQT79385.1 PadR family transcriptional regulator [Aureimonas sp. Leaf460]